MKTRECLAICVMIVAGTTALAAELTPEERWARGIADDFWQALLNDKSEQAAGLLSPELARQLVRIEHYGSVGSGQYIEETAGTYLHSYARGYREATTVTFESSDVSPDRSEVVFRGTLGGRDFNEDKVQGRFTMRIAKEGTGGRWSIRFIDFPEWKLKEDK